MILQQHADDINLTVSKADYSDHFILIVQVPWEENG